MSSRAQALAGVRTEGLRALHGGRRQARPHRLLFSQGIGVMVVEDAALLQRLAR